MNINFPAFKEYSWHGAESVQADDLPWSPQRFCMGMAVQCLDVSLQTRQLVGHAWGFTDEANLNCQKLSREMQTLLTSDSHYTKVCKIHMLDIRNCLVPRDSVHHTPQIPQTLGWKERATSSTCVSDPLGGAGGQRVATGVSGMALGHLFSKGQESRSESGQGRDELIHPVLDAAALSVLASGSYSSAVLSSLRPFCKANNKQSNSSFRRRWYFSQSRVPQMDFSGWREGNVCIAFSTGLEPLVSSTPLWKSMVASFLSGLFLILHSSLLSI